MLQKWGRLWWLLVICAFWSTWADAGDLESIKPEQARVVMTYESLTLPKNEKMGLLGGSLLYDVNSWLALGGSAYGAVLGQRGGFITLGFTANLHKRINDYIEVDTGTFVGAGGGRGGYTLQGGGLMLRSHLGAMLHMGEFGAIGLGVSRVDFPNGSIHSTQPYGSYVLPFSTLAPSGWIHLPEEYAGSWSGVHKAEQEFSVVYRRYSVPVGVVTDNGRPQYKTIGLAGVEWNRYLNEHVFVKVESEGAMQGNSHGYMQILLGAGYRQALIDGTWLKVSAAFGPAGGGSVATGGGVLLDAQLQLQQKLTDHVFAQAGVGYVKAPGGSFRATSFSAMLGYHLFSPNVGDAGPVAVADLAGFDAKHLRIRMVNQRYMKGAPNWRNHHANLDVDLLGYQLDYFVSDRIYLTGQGIGAYKGKGGGYMTGLVGVGVRQSIFGTPLFVEADALGGAAGGGGLDVGGGLVWQADAGIGWQLSKAYSIQVSYGLMRAPKGNFKAKVLSVSLGYYLSIPAM